MCIRDSRREHLDRVRGRESLVERLAVAQVAHLDLDKRAQVARRAVLGFHDEVRLPVMLDYLTFADVVGCGHGVLADRAVRFLCGKDHSYGDGRDCQGRGRRLSALALPGTSCRH